MNLHNETQREKNLDLRGFSSHNVLFTQLTLTYLGGDIGICGVAVLRCSGVANSFVLVAVNKFPILRCCGDLKLYGVQYF